MLIYAILLTVSGFILMNWVSHESTKTVKIGIFKSPQIGDILTLLYIVLLIGGLYCFWQVNYLIVLIICSLFLFGHLAGRNTTEKKARKICQYYKMAKQLTPLQDEQVLMRTTVIVYLTKLGYKDQQIDSVLNGVFSNRMPPIKDIKEVIWRTLTYENVYLDGWYTQNNDQKEFDKKSKAIDKAYESVFGVDNR